MHATACERTTQQNIEILYRSESGWVLATLVRLLGDPELAEESMHEAFAAALEFLATFLVSRANRRLFADLPPASLSSIYCQFGWLRGSRKLLKRNDFLVAGARYVPNRQFLRIPFRSELIRPSA